MKDPCLRVGSVSISLFMQDYNIHTVHFHIPQWLPLTVVPIIYRSVFEHTQHLTYGSRSWYYWQLLRYFSHSNMVMLLSMLVLLNTKYPHKPIIQMLQATIKSLQLGLPASITHNKNKIYRTPKTKKKHPRTTLVSLADRMWYSLPITSVF